MPEQHGLTVAEYRARLKAAGIKERHFIAARNAWRAIVKKRALQLKHAIERRKAQQKPHVVGYDDNKIRGGGVEDRLRFAMGYAKTIFRAEYSQAGSWIKGYAMTNVPRTGGYRTDCSWWYTMVRYACGLQGPSLTGGYTGTILTEGKEVSRRYAETHAGVAVLFGSGTAFHVGMSTGIGPNIYQHGTADIHTGTFDQFGAGTEVRYRAFSNQPL